MKKNILLTLLISTILLAPNKESEEQKQYDIDLHIWMNTLADAFHVVKNKYHQTPVVSQAMSKAIAGFVSLDPHSSFLDAKAYKEIIETTQGQFYGIGVAITNLKETDDEFLLIVDTLPAGPADKAGLKPGDKIVQIEQESLKGMSTEEAVAKLKGKKIRPYMSKSSGQTISHLSLLI